jgi:CubicO group peptidase (beta-lactamase class C family)
VSGEFTALDAAVAEYHARGDQPALVYGIVRDGRLVHARGLGERFIGGPAPDQDTVFRIASMTKSFTAAAVLLLRDEGALALDDPAADYVPGLRSLRPPPDSPPITIRRLLTMTAGFPTDDPWGDRQQGLPLADFAALLAGGLSFAWPPGTRFEYSNLGYAILGLVVAAASGREYAEFVRDRLLVPLEMTRTGYHEREFSPDQLARGHRRRGQDWEELAADPYGAFAPMGGVFTCVSDLARWVSGFLGSFGPSQQGTAHPLCVASRMEMQSPQVTIPPAATVSLPGGHRLTAPETGGYGFGLFIDFDPALGIIVQHAGGYPGFGSIMCWHPGTGVGVIALANSTYAGPSRLAGSLLARAAGEVPVPAGTGGGRPGHLFRAAGGPWQATMAAQRDVMGLLMKWDDATAARLFTPNIAQDEPFPDRRAKIATLGERIGAFTVADRAAEFDSPAHCRWWIQGERGVPVAVSILLTPERQPRVQALTLALPPAADSPLATAMAAVICVLNGDCGALPPAQCAPSLDGQVLSRRLRMAGAWAGRCVPFAFRGGDGETSATVELDGEHARLTLTIATAADGLIQQADVALGP